MPDLYIGLMSGTSMDGIDAALVEFNQNQFQLINTHSHSIPPELKTKLETLALNESGANLDLLGEVDAMLGNIFADAVNALLNKSNTQVNTVKAIGSHGQTIRHRTDIKHPFTLQIADANRIAEKTGITTIADFRRRDIAAGGEGAPLAPAFHNAVFRDEKSNRGILNIGGISNITFLPANKNQTCIGFDTGPGNTLMDAWIKKHLQKNFDQNGEWASSAKPDEALVTHLMQDPFIHKLPPKSTGREHYNLPWLEDQLKQFKHLSNDVIQSSLCEFTVQSILHSIENYLPEKINSLIVCGGGAHNQYLMKQFKNNLSSIEVATTDDYGLPADWVEAVAFAWLAKQTMENKPGNLIEVTGANKPVVLGAIYPA